MLLEAPDAGAEPVAEAARRAVADRVVGCLRGREPPPGLRVAREDQEECAGHDGEERCAEAAAPPGEHEDDPRDREAGDRPRAHDPADGQTRREPGRPRRRPRAAEGGGERERDAERGSAVGHRVGRVVAERGADDGERRGEERNPRTFCLRTIKPPI